MFFRHGARTRTAGAVLAGSLLALLSPAGVQAQAPTSVHTEDCVAVLANPKVPLENVDYLVPDDFTIATEPDPADPLRELVALDISGDQCERVKIGDSGTPRKSTWVAFRVPLDPLAPPAGHGPQPPPHLDTYQLWLASDNPDFIDLLRREGGEDAQDAVYVENLEFKMPADGEGPFKLTAPRPTPSPFRIEADVYERVDVPISEITVHHYSTSRQGWMVLGDPDGEPDRIRNVRLGAAEGRVIAEPNTQLANVFCDDNRDGSFQNNEAGNASYEMADFTVNLRRNSTDSRPPARCP